MRRLTAAARVLVSLGALLALIVGLTVIEVGQAFDRIDAASRIDTTATTITQLLDLGAAVETERGYLTGEAFAAGLGATPSMILTFTGVDMDAQLAQARQQADELVAVLGASSPISASDLAAARQAGISGLDPIVARIAQARDEQINVLRTLAQSTGESDGLGTAVDDLATVSELAPSIVTQTFDALNVMVAFDDRPITDRVQDLLLAQATTHQLYDELTARANAVGDAARALRDSDSYRQIDELSSAQATAKLTSGPQRPVGLNELTGLTSLWHATATNQQLSTAVLDSSIEELRAATRHVAASGRARVTQSLGILAAALLLMVLCALWLVRTVVRPIVALERYAEQLSAGEPPTAPLGPGGAREMQVAAAAMNRLLEALQIVEQQATALAAGDVDDPVLVRHLPGRLGAALAGAFGRLSLSIATSQAVTERLAFEATHDGLTQLPNRRAALSALEAATNRSTPVDRLLVAFFVDLDGFKQVNDQYGHDAGDTVLRTIGQRLEAAVRDGDLVARLGGDEFLILADGIRDQAEIDALCRRLHAAIEAPIDVNDTTAVAVGASIGIATHEPGQPAENLLRDADKAMYTTKASSRRS